MIILFTKTLIIDTMLAIIIDIRQNSNMLNPTMFKTYNVKNNELTVAFINV